MATPTVTSVEAASPSLAAAPSPSSAPPVEATQAAPSFVVATWNVNSLRMRLVRLLPWLAAEKPDVLCLQELKMQESEFPLIELQAAGYHAVALGQKTYNGVAILSRVEHGTPVAVEAGFKDGDAEPDARLLVATIPGLGLRVASVYVPNGQTIDSDKYPYKLRWLERFERYLASRLQGSAPSPGPEAQTGQPAQSDPPGAGLPWVICGDYNIAPDDRDVYDPAGWQDTVICHRDVRAAWQRLVGLGLVDVLRKAQPEQTIYTYWDYRGLSFPKNLGLRIDHVLCSPQLGDRIVEARVDRSARKGEKPSDHAPLLVRFRR
jgi:exodeoxyribonuclease-3